MTFTGVAAMARDWCEYAAMGIRCGRDLPPYLRAPLSLDDARQRIRDHLQFREQRFLRMVETTIYGYAGSPYRRLLDHAGCEWGDLQRLVAQEGIEGALRRLAEAGVYVTFDELKGRRAAVRGSARFTFLDREFDNPCVRPHYVELTGGTRGRPSEVRRSLGTITDQAASFALALAAHGIQQPRNVFWTGASPAWAVAHLKLGNTVDAWFYPLAPMPPVATAFIAYVRLLARTAGHRLPPMVHCDLTEPERLVRWLANRSGDGRPIVVNTSTSSAVRVASAADALGVSLRGVTFHCRSEPFTDSRRRTIEQCGAYALADYAAVELSSIAYGCPHRRTADDMHLNVNRYAVIERERLAIENGPLVDALLFTTLSPDAQKIALNAETGDSAVVEERACGCELGSLGLRTHLSEIRSFEKLSSEGTSFARSNVIQILEEMLPARFGGTALEYQLVEEEADAGSSLLVLRAHPSLGAIDESALLATVLEELRHGGLANAYQAQLIERAQSIVVRRLPPLATGAGKVLPFHLAPSAGTARKRVVSPGQSP